ncbi:MAG TPA: cytochrome c3 family protein [Pyrinomonadaceae bacterium]|nr:cytochrome c3 family protein [Pyrinomonadaceae bacterium]
MRSRTHRVRKMIVLMMVPLAFVTFDAAVNSGSVEAQRRSQPRRPVKRAEAPRPRIDYSQFSHVTHVTAQKLACDSCHKVPTKNWKEVRKGDAAFPDVAEFPEHSACLNCHRTQFFARERPAPSICSNCHVNVTPRDTTRFLFPSLGDLTDVNLKTRDSVSEFNVGFPHDKHLDVLGLNFIPFRGGPGAASASRPTLNNHRFVSISWQEKKSADQSKTCAICHKTYQPQGSSSEEYVTKPPKNLGDNFWVKKGTFQTVPNSHAVCFTCHNADSGIPPDSKDCHVCHKLADPAQQLKTDFDPKLPADMGITDKTILARWRSRISAGAFRHEGGEHPNLSCMSCHHVAGATFNTVNRQSLKVPVRSCGGAEGCHITATADDGGALNFEIDRKKANPAFVCSKCHITFGKEGMPANHLAAIPKTTK